MLILNKTELIDFFVETIQIETKFFFIVEGRPYLDSADETPIDEINSYFKSDLLDLDIKDICEQFNWVFSQYKIDGDRVFANLML